MPAKKFLLLSLLPLLAQAEGMPTPLSAAPVVAAHAPASSTVTDAAIGAGAAASATTSSAAPPSASVSSPESASAAGKPSSTGVTPLPLEHPVVFFTLPTHGALADMLDRGAIRLGTSGHIDKARNMLVSMPRSPVPMAMSCADINARMAVEKALKSVADEALKGGRLVLMEGGKCPPAFVADAQRAGIDTRPSDTVFPYQLLQSGPR